MIPEIVELARKKCQEWHEQDLKLFEFQENNEDVLIYHLLKNLYHNYQIWHLIEGYTKEDKEEVKFIYEGGAINNRLRNDEAVALDEYFYKLQKNKTSICCSEGIGAILDKVNILTIKMFHLRDINDPRLEIITAHRENQIKCAHELLEDMMEGKRYYEIFTRFKITGEDF